MRPITPAAVYLSRHADDAEREYIERYLQKNPDALRFIDLDASPRFAKWIALGTLMTAPTAGVLMAFAWVWFRG